LWVWEWVDGWVSVRMYSAAFYYIYALLLFQTLLLSFRSLSF
jgi:hypothetical protein